MFGTAKRNFGFVFLACATLAACDAPQVVRPSTVNVTQTNVSKQRVDAFARQFLNQIQPATISERREFCGFFVVTGGQLAATQPSRGTAIGCDYGPFPTNTVASYHTHGASDPNYDNEVPSGNDLRHALDAKVDDYVSTPGGRLWRVDGQTGNANQLCGLGCLSTDPQFIPQNEQNVRQSYTIDTLRTRQGT